MHYQFFPQKNRIVNQLVFVNCPEQHVLNVGARVHADHRNHHHCAFKWTNSCLLMSPHPLPPLCSLSFFQFILRNQSYERKDLWGQKKRRKNIVQSSQWRVKSRMNHFEVVKHFWKICKFWKFPKWLIRLTCLSNTNYFKWTVVIWPNLKGLYLWWV